MSSVFEESGGNKNASKGALEDYSKAGCDEEGTMSGSFSIVSSALDEEEDYPKTQQEELNEILEAFYELVSDETLRAYQEYIKEIESQSLASKALQSPDKAPDFELPDQDGETVRLYDEIRKGPVVLVFYRGKWCPHCNAVMINMQKILPEIKGKGGSVIAISPMLPDGTAVFATKRDLQFPVLSDVGNVVARQFRLTFQVPNTYRPLLLSIGDNIPGVGGDDSWEIPLPATYIINQQAELVWSFIDDDQHYRAEPAEILAAMPLGKTNSGKDDQDDGGGLSTKTRQSYNPCNIISRRNGGNAPPRWRRALTPPPPPAGPARERTQSADNADDPHGSTTTTAGKSRGKKIFLKRFFGRKKQEPMEFLGNYLLPN